MNNLVLASSPAEADALEKARARLAETAGTLGVLTANVQASAANATGGDVAAADQAKLVDFAEQEFLPLSASLIAALASAGATDAGAAALAAVGARLSARVSEAARFLARQDAPQRVASAAARVREAGGAFLDQAAELGLPVLAQSPAVDLARVLPAAAVPDAAAPGTGGCACGGHDEPGPSELDTRVIPHAIRHATIFGALDGLGTGRGILLVANHNPLPLLAQLEQRAPGRFTVDYVESGPEVWRLSMVRR
ncbi:DUF2249 domain-containing protein [Specibacter cremeus]|uniref:DUF2249 domain-containing protein n=1 Tax=Specibacter cremeus TaxID=1629051 RepID=UPI0013DE484D|nr:DUF2249 domain-containing protein [Specibacter cremeus]